MNNFFDIYFLSTDGAAALCEESGEKARKNSPSLEPFRTFFALSGKQEFYLFCHFVLCTHIWRVDNLVFFQYFIRCFPFESTVLEVVVIYIPSFEFLFQVLNTLKDVSLVEFLLILTMRTFHRSILSRFSRINEVMRNIFCGTELIKAMEGLHGHITSFVGSGVVVRES